MNKINRIILLSLIFLTHFTYAEIKPAKEVFFPTADIVGNQTEIKIDFPSDYYIYADKITINGAKNYSSDLQPTEKNDPYLGKTLIWEQPLILKLNTAVSHIKLTLQGCQRDVICYPPTTWDLKADLKHTSFQPPKLLFKNNQVLAVESAFITNFSYTDNNDLIVSVDMPDSYYLYKDKIEVQAQKNIEISLPKGEIHRDDFFGEREIYRTHVDFIIPKNELTGEQLQLTMQGCAEGRICYPPFTQVFPLKPTITGHKSNTSSLRMDKALAFDEHMHKTLNERFWLALPLVFLLGVAVSFTACVYPLIPIVTSIVVGKDVQQKRALQLISIYVLGMGVAMALLGAIFAAFNVNLQVLLQKPAATIFVALFFGVLSLSLFDIYTLQMPTFLQNYINKLNRKQQVGSCSGTFVMGALSVLVVSPCATPILTTLLIFTTQTTVFKGALTLFLFGIGTGLPLFIFASAFKKYMPRAGEWMNVIKYFFACIILGIAVWLLTRITSSFFFNLGWLLYSAFISIYVLPSEFPAKTFKQKISLYISMIAFLIGIAFAVNLFRLSETPTIANNHEAKLFTEIHTLAEVKNAVQNSDRPVLLDFYADWCISCHKWERDIWNNPRFDKELKKFMLLKVDITNFNDAHKEIFNQFNIVAPPAVVVLTAKNTELKPLETIIGELDADDFEKKIKNW